jgi:hypothetical protein
MHVFRFEHLPVATAKGRRPEHNARESVIALSLTHFVFLLLRSPE